MSESQNQAILEHLQSGNAITPMDALKLFGCFRLGARIWDLEQAGHKIKHESVTENGKTFAKYSIEPEAPRPVLIKGQFAFNFIQPGMTDRP